MTARRRRDLRNGFLYWWPVTARLGGLAGAFGFGAYAALTHSAPDAGVLAFCGALIIVPTVLDTQDRRNGKSPSRDPRDPVEDDGS